MPYDLGLCLSSTLMNQILKLQIEGGLLALDLTELNVFGGLTQLTTDLIAIFFPSLSAEAATRVELPELLGLSIDPKEVALVGTCIGVFGDFAAAP